MERYVNVTGMGVYYRRRIVLPCRFMIVDFSWSLVTVCPKFACSLYRTFIQNMLTVTFAHCIYSMPQLLLFLGLERCSTYSRATTVWEWRLLTLVNIHCPHMLNMTSQVDKVFCLDSIVHRYHVYKTVWAAFWGKILTATREPKNDHDIHAVYVKKDGRIVGHVLQELSRTVWPLSPWDSPDFPFASSPSELWRSFWGGFALCQVQCQFNSGHYMVATSIWVNTVNHETHLHIRLTVPM